jgi:hypothetical protein
MPALDQHRGFPDQTSGANHSKRISCAGRLANASARAVELLLVDRPRRSLTSSSGGGRTVGFYQAGFSSANRLHLVSLRSAAASQLATVAKKALLEEEDLYASVRRGIRLLSEGDILDEMSNARSLRQPAPARVTRAVAGKRS